MKRVPRSPLVGEVLLAMWLIMSTSTSQASFQKVTQTLRDRLAHRPRNELSVPNFRLASVVALLSERQGEPALLYIVRTNESPNHPGQIAFPGGNMAKSDADAVACGRREVFEEVGIRDFEVLGLGDDALTPAGFVVTPIYASLEANAPVVPNPREVASYFWAPLSKLRSLEKTAGTRTVAGISAPMYKYLFGDHDIWGVTARMTKLLLDLTSDTMQ